MNLNTSEYTVTPPWRSFPEVILPDSSRVFWDRAKRFAHLAKGHSLSGWLTFLGHITESQHRLLTDYPALPLPKDTDLALSRKNGMPPLAVSSWPRDPVWRETLTGLIDDVRPHAPAVTHDTLTWLRAQDGATLEDMADQILRIEFDPQSVSFLPYISAALQVHFTALASAADETTIERLDVPGVCPCCGFLPVGSVVRTDSAIPNLRYLHCGLCNTQWHLVRVTCAACQDGGSGIAFRSIEGKYSSVCAETCDACKSYLKIIYREKSPDADPVADDLATLSLDLLLDAAGYDRMSPNLMFMQST